MIRGSLYRSLVRRLRSLRFATNGIAHAFKTEGNLAIHFAFSIAVCCMAAYLGLSADEWRWLVVAMVLVWQAELLNTALEYLCDLVTTEFHPIIEKAKDIAAGAVLICAAGATVIGMTVFLPYLP